MNVTIYLFAFFFTSVLWALPLPRAVSLAGAELSRSIVQEICLPTRHFRGATTLIYGNRYYGYFETETEARENERCASVIPPGYRYPLTTGVRESGGIRRVKTLHLKNPFPPLFDSAQSDSFVGKPSFNFVLLNGAIPNPFTTQKGRDGGSNRAIHFVYVLNRFNEIVWIYFPKGGREAIHDVSLHTKPVGKGRYALLHTWDKTYFEIFDWRGHCLSELDPQISERPYPLHNDFIVLNEHEMLAIGNSMKYVRNPKRFWSTPRSYLGSTVVRVRLATNSSQVLWSAFDSFHPLWEKDWDPSYPIEENWVSWRTPKANYDFTHANSIQPYGEGNYLVSVRNLNKLVLFNSDFSKVLWTLGQAPENDYRPASGGDRFYRQHHAQEIEGRILLLDNGQLESRVIELKLMPEEHQYSVVKEYRPVPSIFSMTRGSVFLLPNKNPLALFPSRPGKPFGHLYLVEFDALTQKESFRAHFDYGIDGVGYRAVPLESIGTETFLGFDDAPA